MFTVYTYFGRVLETFPIGPKETHHKAMESSRLFALKYERETGKPAWIKLTDSGISEIIETVDTRIEALVEYETSHVDAGANYAYMVPELIWTNVVIDRLNEYVRDWSVEDYFAPDAYRPIAKVMGLLPEWKDLDPNELEEALAESFEMSSGSKYGPHCGGFDIAAFNVGEVEIDISHLIEGLTREEVAEVIDGSSYQIAITAGSEEYTCISQVLRKRGPDVYAYNDTDAIWFAVINVDTFNEYVRDNFIDD